MVLVALLSRINLNLKRTMHGFNEHINLSLGGGCRGRVGLLGSLTNYTFLAFNCTESTQRRFNLLYRSCSLGATENAGLENAAPDCRGGKRGSSTVWKAEVSVI